MKQPPRKSVRFNRRNFNALIRNLSPRNPSYSLTFRFARADGRDIWLEEEAKGEFDSTEKLLRIKGLTRDITERKELEDHKNSLIAELDHRVKNVLATVCSIASRTQETSCSMTEFVAALEGRIKSMAITHELLSTRHWRGIPLAELVHRELAPYATASNGRHRRSRALVPLIPSSHSPIHLEPSVWAPLSAVVRPQICWAVIPREGQAVPVVNRRGPCVPRSDRHESNAAARTGGPC